MSKLYLITGFLGSGKTTFLRNFITLFKDKKIRLIINEFGKAGIDGDLLSDLDAIIKEISGGSVFCACRMDQFETALHECGKNETIIVEASGLSDPTGVRKLFSGANRFPDIEYKGAVCLADAVRFPKIYATSQTAVRQIASSDIIFLNKTDIATQDQIKAAEELIKGQRPDIKIIKTSFGKIQANLLSELDNCKNNDLLDMPLVADITIKHLTVILSSTISSYELEKFIQMFSENTFRVKGFIKTRDNGLVIADCVGNVVSVKKTDIIPTKEKIGVLNILSGAKMPVYSSVKKACDWYKNYIVLMTQS